MTNQAGVKDNWNSCYNGTQVGQWTGLSVSQQKQENCTRYVTYVQKIVIDGVLKFETVIEHCSKRVYFGGGIRV